MAKKMKPAETFDEYLAAVVATRMAKRSKRQEDVAEATGIPLSNLGRRLRGRVPFTAEEIARVGRYLQFDAAAMLQEALDDMGGYGPLLSEVRADNAVPELEDELPANVVILSRRQSEGLGQQQEAAHRVQPEEEGGVNVDDEGSDGGGGPAGGEGPTRTS